MMKFVFSGVLMMSLVSTAFGQTESPVIADGAKVEKVGSGYGFTEGCTADKDGNVFFTDQAKDPGQILRWSAEDGTISVWMQPSGRANGQRFAPNGDLIACADEHCQLWRITPDKKVTVLVKDYNGKLLDGPNDVWILPNGAMYLTDPYYHRPWWGPEHAVPQQDKRAVYYLAPGASTLVRVIDDFVMPNGIGGTPDGKILYASDINGGKTWKYDIQEDGSLKNKTLFCNAGSDGMTMDNQGNVYCTSGGIKIFDKTGKQIERIPPPEGNQPANIAIGGKEHNILFIAARANVYTLKLKVKNWDQK